MKRTLIALIGLIILFGCSNKKTGAADNAMKIVEERFSKSHLKDSLGESQMTYLWAEYDSEFNSILCFQYGGCAIEYYYHALVEALKRDTFIVRGERPIVDELSDTYKKMTGGYSDYSLDRKQNSFMKGFSRYFKDSYPTEEAWIESHINGMAKNQIIQ